MPMPRCRIPILIVAAFLPRLPRYMCPSFVRTNSLESARNRPERYGPTTPADSANPRYARFAELVRTGMDPAEVARRVLAAIRDDELYVFTHPDRRGAVEERFRAILAAFDK